MLENALIAPLSLLFVLMLNLSLMATSNEINFEINNELSDKKADIQTSKVTEIRVDKINRSVLTPENMQIKITTPVIRNVVSIARCLKSN